MKTVNNTMPILALRGLSVFPGMVVHFDVGREKSQAALDAAMRSNQEIFLVAQRDLRVGDPGYGDLCPVGTIAKIKQILKVSGNNVRVMTEGIIRGRVAVPLENKPYLCGEIVPLPDRKPPGAAIEIKALMRQVREIMRVYTLLAFGETDEQTELLLASEDPGYLCDYIAQNIRISREHKQALLEQVNLRGRLRMLLSVLEEEIKIIRVEKDVFSRVRENFDRTQRENILREQMKVIQEELAGEDELFDDTEEYKEKIAALALCEESRGKLEKELRRLKGMSPYSSEAAVIRNYLDVCVGLPWGVETEDCNDLAKVSKILNADHFGLVKVKERILEFMAVRSLAASSRSQILCLVGPPGVGKTSIGMGIAKAMGRKIARVSLGGVRDEADIRGHRKTYIGAMPGRIMTGLTEAGSRNCVILLDEIDKMSHDFRGDPSAALLEVLDAEHNSAFRDHFVELPFDLSKVLFITTANTMDGIPRPLADRMEIIEIASYTDEEKLQIARRHLLPKLYKQYGIKPSACSISPAALREILEGYTREAGVRGLERALSAVLRKGAKGLVAGDFERLSVTPKNVPALLGVRKFFREPLSNRSEIGVANGLAWTSVGGELLEVEVSVLDGSGKIELTGNLGDVMKESAKAAISFLRSRAKSLGIASDFYKTKDVHIHFPEGATPKDGPSAGITMTVALASVLTGRAVRRDVAMTGEITLRGRVLPIGGLKEKSMAAYRAGIKEVLIPRENGKDLEEIDPTVAKSLRFILVQNADDAFLHALLPPVQPCAEPVCTVPLKGETERAPAPLLQ